MLSWGFPNVQKVVAQKSQQNKCAKIRISPGYVLIILCELNYSEFGKFGNNIPLPSSKPRLPAYGRLTVKSRSWRKLTSLQWPSCLFMSLTSNMTWAPPRTANWLTSSQILPEIRVTYTWTCRGLLYKVAYLTRNTKATRFIGSTMAVVWARVFASVCSYHVS